MELPSLGNELSSAAADGADVAADFENDPRYRGSEAIRLNISSVVLRHSLTIFLAGRDGMGGEEGGERIEIGVGTYCFALIVSQRV